MAHVIIRRYSTFFDHRTNVQFNPVLDKRSGMYVGLAAVADDQLPYFRTNAAYEVLSDADLTFLTTGKLAPVEPVIGSGEVDGDIDGGPRAKSKV